MEKKEDQGTSNGNLSSSRRFFETKAMIGVRDYSRDSMLHPLVFRLRITFQFGFEFWNV